jgi:class 3 adenylate cyclase
MVGEPVVLAYRIEKFANRSTGPIIACSTTRSLVGDAFEFKDLGEHTAKGFDAPHHLYSLVKERR